MSDQSSSSAESSPREEEPRPPQAKSDRERRTRRARRIGLRVAVVVAVLLVLLAAAPWIIARTPLRDVVLNWALPGNRMQVATSGAELGWTSSVRLNDLVVTDRERREFRMEADEIKFDKSWLRLWADDPDLGNATLTRPRIDLEMARLVPSDVPGESTPITMSAVAYDTSLRVISPRLTEPVLDLSGLDLTFRIERSPAGRILYVDPLVVLDRYELTPEVCDEGLQLVAPILADVGRVDGSMSLDIDNFRMPLDPLDPEQRRQLTDIEGQVRLHEVNTGLRNPVLREVIANLGKLLGFEMPDTVRTAENTVIDFHVRNGRVHHEGLAFFVPGITSDMPWKSTGSVGFDESLDLTITAPLPAKVLSDSRLANRLSKQTIELQIGGTMEEPEIELPEDQNWLWELGEAVLAESDEPAAEEAVIDQFVSKARAVIETGELAVTLWDWASEWWSGEESGEQAVEGQSPQLPANSGEESGARRGATEAEDEDNAGD